MKKTVGLAILAASILFSATAFASEQLLLPDLQAPQQLVPYGAVSRDEISGTVITVVRRTNL